MDIMVVDIIEDIMLPMSLMLVIIDEVVVMLPIPIPVDEGIMDVLPVVDIIVVCEVESIMAAATVASVMLLDAAPAYMLQSIVTAL